MNIDIQIYIDNANICCTKITCHVLTCMVSDVFTAKKPSIQICCDIVPLRTFAGVRGPALGHMTSNVNGSQATGQAHQEIQEMIKIKQLDTG